MSTMSLRTDTRWKQVSEMYVSVHFFLSGWKRWQHDRCQEFQYSGGCCQVLNRFVRNMWCSYPSTELRTCSWVWSAGGSIIIAFYLAQGTLTSWLWSVFEMKTRIVIAEFYYIQDNTDALYSPILDNQCCNSNFNHELFLKCEQLQCGEGGCVCSQ